MKETVIVDLKVESSGAKDGLNKVDDQLKKTGQDAGNAKKSLKDVADTASTVPGPLSRISTGLKGVLQGFKALIANPIVLIIVALTGAIIGLVKAFTSLKGGGEKVEQLMTGIGAVVDVLRDRFVKFAQSVLLLFSGDLKGAIEGFRESYKGIGEEIKQEFLIASEAKASLQALYDLQRLQNIERAKTNLLIADAREKLLDETISINDRLKALKVVKDTEISLAERETAAAEAKYLSLKALADLSDSSKETLDELAAAEIDYYSKQEASATKRRTLAKQEKRLRDEQKRAEEQRLKEVQDQTDRENAIRNKYNQWVLDQKAKQADEDFARLEELTAKENEEANKQLEIQQKLTKDKLELKERERIATLQTIGAIGKALDGFSQLAKEQSEEAKALAVANALINTYLAANQVLADKTLPTVAKAFAVAGIVAAGLANVRKITQIDASNGITSVSGGNSAPPSIRPTSSFTRLDNTKPINVNGQEQLTRVVVLESDITGVQNKVNSIKAKATIG
jgi:hypothetical protein